MSTKRVSRASTLAVVIAVAAIGGGAMTLQLLQPGAEELELTPGPVLHEASRSNPSGPQVGVGSGAAADGALAAREALAASLVAGHEPPGFAMLFATSPTGLSEALAEVRRSLGAPVRVYGGTSDAGGVLTHRGLAAGAKQAQVTVGLLTLASSEIAFGVGGAALEKHSSVRAAAREATVQAVRSAGRRLDERPRAVLLASSIPNVRQGDVLEGIATVVGAETPVLGARVGAAITGHDSVGEGVCVAVLYTDLPVGWVFEGGYDVSSSHSGVITRMEGESRVVEIDGQPALDVYDAWLGGSLRRLYRDNPAAVAIEQLDLNPLYTRYRSSEGEVYSIFAHTWPADESLKEAALEVGTRMTEGERLYLANGTWETLLNRIAHLPRAARRRGDMETVTPIMGFGYVCSGVFSVIPPGERAKAPLLMSQSQGGTPFLAPVSWGEHGYLPGVGNRFGNLLTSFLVIGPRPTGDQDGRNP